MIFFDCPHCGEQNDLWLAEDHVGEYERVRCRNCQKDCYVRHSRIDPIVLTYEEISARKGFVQR